MKTYFIPINPLTEEDRTQTVDVLELRGTKKQRIKAWRNYLRVRLGSNDVHKFNHVAKEMGFEELIP